MDITNFDQWLNTLGEALQKAEKAGMSDQTIVNSAKQLGDYLASNVEPDVPQNRLLKEMWENGTEEEQKAMASMLVKMVKNRNLH
ncbi:MAG: hypothetical protein PWP31_1063 [Clostridia bacterium]|nr:hypothetical protein [Clostridia bacterium]